MQILDWRPNSYFRKFGLVFDIDIVEEDENHIVVRAYYRQNDCTLSAQGSGPHWAIACDRAVREINAKHPREIKQAPRQSKYISAEQITFRKLREMSVLKVAHQLGYTKELWGLSAKTAPKSESPQGTSIVFTRGTESLSLCIMGSRSAAMSMLERYPNLLIAIVDHEFNEGVSKGLETLLVKRFCSQAA